MFTTVKNSLSGEKKIIFFVVLFIFLSSIFLFHEEQKKINSTNENGWWSVYFENPKSQDLNFVIKNNGEAKKFRWKAIAKKDKDETLKEADVYVPAGEISYISFSISDTRKGEKVSLEVSDENDEKKEIYKLLD
jgi:hypothetical protein